MFKFNYKITLWPFINVKSIIAVLLFVFFSWTKKKAANPDEVAAVFDSNLIVGTHTH